jgi:predicted nucleic acid-binding protein
VSWIVADASVTLPWCFPDEQTPASVSVLDIQKTGDQALVLAFWYSEVLNSLLVGERKGRVSTSQTRGLLNESSDIGR